MPAVVLAPLAAILGISVEQLAAAIVAAIVTYALVPIWHAIKPYVMDVVNYAINQFSQTWNTIVGDVSTYTIKQLTQFIMHLTAQYAGMIYATNNRISWVERWVEGLAPKWLKSTVEKLVSTVATIEGSISYITHVLNNDVYNLDKRVADLEHSLEVMIGNKIGELQGELNTAFNDIKSHLGIEVTGLGAAIGAIAVSVATTAKNSEECCATNASNLSNGLSGIMQRIPLIVLGLLKKYFIDYLVKALMAFELRKYLMWLFLFIFEMILFEM